MSVIKLDDSHSGLVLDLFKNGKYMGINATSSHINPKHYNSDSNEELYYNTFRDTYLSGLSRYHAYGYLNSENRISVIIAFLESIDEPSWYWNSIRSDGVDKSHIHQTLDVILKHNESHGRLKFYSLFPKKYARSYRKLIYSKEQCERYDYFDEYWVPERNQNKFNSHWQTLYSRVLLPVDTIVRCTYLKREYRQELYNASVYNEL